MSMSKKDFVSLADTLRPLYKQHKIDAEMLGALCQFCKQQNPNFMAGRWTEYLLEHCGPNGGKVKVSAIGH